MLTQPLWLPSLLLLAASATAHPDPPIGLKPRSLSMGTAPPYPTTTSSTDIIAPSTSSPPSTPTSTSSPDSPTPTPSSFHLKASGTGTYLDGYYLTIGREARGAGHGDLQVISFISELPPDELLYEATFHLADNKTIVVGGGGGGDGKAFGDASYNYWFFNSRQILETGEVFESVCEIVGGDGDGDGGGELRCVTGPNTVFFVCVEVFTEGPYEGRPVNDRDLIPLLGREVEPGCNGVPLTVLVVPV